MYEYFGVRRVYRDFGDAIGTASYVPVCPKCGRFVKPDPAESGTYLASELEGIIDGIDNATCSRCGRVEMPCEGFD